MTEASGAPRRVEENASRRLRFAVQPVLALLCVAVLALSFFLMLQGVAPFSTHFYELAWWSLIGIADGAVWWRTRKSLLESAPGCFVILSLWSVAFWLLFEIINLRLQNWYYIYVIPGTASRWFGIFVAFATVLPAIYLSAELVRSFLAKGQFRQTERRAPRWLTPLFLVIGILSLLLPLLSPQCFYPLTWGFVFFLLEPLNYRFGGNSLIRDWERGSCRQFGTYLAAGLVCGLLWELLNYWAQIKWIYTVPFFEKLKLFEMPLAGFLGFPPFAVECYVLMGSLQRFRLLPSLPDSRSALRPSGMEKSRCFVSLAAAAAAAVLGAAIALPRMERHTFASVYPEGTEMARALGKMGIVADQRVEDLDAFTYLRLLEERPPSERSRETVDFLRLVTLAGVGFEKALALRDAGVRSLDDLAHRDDAELYAALKERPGDSRLTRAEIRVWLRAARKVANRSPRHH